MESIHPGEEQQRALTIAQDALGSSFSTVRLAAKQGHISTVYVVSGSGNEAAVVKVNRASHFEAHFRREAKCARLAAAAGIPTPVPISVGLVGEYAYSVLPFIEGVTGAELAPSDILHLYRTIGEWARRINDIPLLGFGVEPLLEGRGKESLTEWYESELERMIGLSGTIKGACFSDSERSALRRCLVSSEPEEMRAVLTHGDLSHENVLIGETGAVLLDWGNGLGGSGLPFEIAPVMMWQSEGRISNFCLGYGVSYEQCRDRTDRCRIWYALRILEWFYSPAYVGRRGVNEAGIFRVKELIRSLVDRTTF